MKMDDTMTIDLSEEESDNEFNDEELVRLGQENIVVNLFF